MVSNLVQLLENVDYFYKTAGLLKVPEKQLKEASDWIVTCYCHAVAQKLEDQILGNKVRVKVSGSLPRLLTDWRHIVEQIGSLRLLTQNEDLAIEKLAELANFIGLDGKKLPYFNEDEIDKTTQMTGIVDTNVNCMRMYLAKNDNDTFYFSLRVKFSKKDEETISLYEQGHNEPFAQIIAKLTSNINKIETVIDYFDQFVNRYKIFDKTYLKNITVVYGACKRLSQGFSAQNGIVTDPKRIEFPVTDIPYGRYKPVSGESGAVNKRDATSAIYAALITSKTEADKLYKGSFGGLWVKGDWDKWPNSTYIGTLYVYADMNEEDASLPGSISSLNNMIVRLRNITRHEIQHFVQDFQWYLNADIKDAGRPGKNISERDKYDANGRVNPNFIGPHQDIIETDGPHKGYINHTLRDVEFYTRLSDAVSYFHTSSSDWPKFLHRDLMLYCIDHISRAQLHNNCTRLLQQYYNRIMGLEPNKYSYDTDIKQQPEKQKLYYEAERRAYQTFTYVDSMSLYAINSIRHFFVALKQYQPPKYRKAVSIFINSVGL